MKLSVKIANTSRTNENVLNENNIQYHPILNNLISNPIFNYF